MMDILKLHEREQFSTHTLTPFHHRNNRCMDPFPYNITISSQSPALVYYPTRDENNTIEGGWSVTYTHGTVDTDLGTQGVGDGYLQTTYGSAGMSVTWVGTAVYIYGNSTSSGSYGIDMTNAGRRVNLEHGDPKSNLLARVTDMAYGSHTFNMNLLPAHNGDVLAIHYVVLTIGIDSSLQNWSVPAVLNDKPNDAFFEFRTPPPSTKWSIDSPNREEILPNGDRQAVPRSMMGSIESTTDPSLIFRLTNTSAFFVRGFVGTGTRNHSKTALLTPGLDGDLFKVTKFNEVSEVLDFDQILYWESGLDPNQTYMVELRGAPGSAGSQNMFFHTLDIIGGSSSLFNSTPSSTASDSSSKTSSLGPVDPTREPESNQSPRVPRKLSAGSIAGITVGTVLVVITLAILALCRLQRRRRDQALEIVDVSSITPFVGEKSHYPRQAGSKRSPIHETEPPVDPSPSSESNSNSTPSPSVSASVTRRALRHLRGLRFAIPAPVHEIDAGPVTLPPQYDNSWVASANMPASEPVSTGRALPIPPGPPAPSSKAERNDLEQTTGPSSS